MSAGVFYCNTTIFDIIAPQTTVFTRPTDYLIEVLFVMALLLTLVAYAGLHALHRSRAGRFELCSYAITTGGTTCFTLAAIATLVAGREVLGVLFLFGVLAAFLGSICFGMALLQANILPRWISIMLMLALPVSVLLDAVGGGILLGLVWLAVGYTITRLDGEILSSGSLSIQH